MRRRQQKMAQDLIPGLVDQSDLDWDRLVRARYLVRQAFRYEYESPIRRLRHRLIVVPPDQHGDQRTLMSHLRFMPEAGRLTRRSDRYGNSVVEIRFPEVDSAVDFEARIVVERSVDDERRLQSAEVAPRWLKDRGLLTPAGLTEPGPRLRRMAGELAREGLAGLELADRINRCVREALDYRPGVTGIHTSAEEALVRGSGVCQDYTHVMLALCRLLRLPARYVSGHLLGEGGTHAWVEALVPSLGAGPAAAYGFDPTHGRPTGIRYVTVAVGKDYGDVAPTSGSYVGGSGHLTSAKRVDVVGFDYA
ncbi:MAG: transglutaminase family protein [Candidatus Dormibacter sp.]|uniref:transglutaminase family protein n=1 Tax=Candidatus Dormibacter sp. TaxID=2973982 RepID=UPI000DAFE745|nr:MAG: transglutaminase family protein [Candidatus Dormibacteraeota bacterium]